MQKKHFLPLRVEVDKGQVFRAADEGEFIASIDILTKALSTGKIGQDVPFESKPLETNKRLPEEGLSRQINGRLILKDRKEFKRSRNAIYKTTLNEIRGIRQDKAFVDPDGNVFRYVFFRRKNILYKCFYKGVSINDSAVEDGRTNPDELEEKDLSFRVRCMVDNPEDHDDEFFDDPDDDDGVFST